MWEQISAGSLRPAHGPDSITSRLSLPASKAVSLSEELEEAIASEAAKLRQLGSGVLPRRLTRQRPPFTWQIAQDYETEFCVSGPSKEVVTKVGNFADADLVIPAGSTWRLAKGGVYRWTVLIDKICPQRPQLHLGVHGASHRRPWRLISSTRGSTARDDDQWLARPGGDRAIREGDYVHLELDLRGLHLPFGTLAMAVNSEPSEVVFDDIPLSGSSPLMPIVSMGGDKSQVRLCPAY
eukprot:TRINITY_DN120757_c0_g1_i1.p1 TRINITY_DN120757_c0_g1~~TRINITY_DN120757_c0_g1_i1.p1  ORF type:complete len:238 (+),score=16.39 TRINITY_DN120757_c0_g1_i1:161-874(+)